MSASRLVQSSAKYVVTSRAYGLTRPRTRTLPIPREGANRHRGELTIDIKPLHKGVTLIMTIIRRSLPVLALVGIAFASTACSSGTSFPIMDLLKIFMG